LEVKREDMLARVNYSYIKFQKELANKKKKEEKRQNKLKKKDIQPVEGLESASDESVTVV
jgi:hypothetical protein